MHNELKKWRTTAHGFLVQPGFLVSLASFEPVKQLRQHDPRPQNLLPQCQLWASENKAPLRNTQEGQES